jgi:hypothetical protein
VGWPSWLVFAGFSFVSSASCSLPLRAEYLENPHGGHDHPSVVLERCMPVVVRMFDEACSGSPPLLVSTASMTGQMLADAFAAGEGGMVQLDLASRRSQCFGKSLLPLVCEGM